MTFLSSNAFHNKYKNPECKIEGPNELLCLDIDTTNIYRHRREMTNIDLLYIFFHLFILHGVFLLSIVIPRGQLHNKVRTRSKINNEKI